MVFEYVVLQLRMRSPQFGLMGALHSFDLHFYLFTALT